MAEIKEKKEWKLESDGWYYCPDCGSRGYTEMDIFCCGYTLPPVCEKCGCEFKNLQKFVDN